MQVPEVDALRAGGLLEALFERGAKVSRSSVAADHLCVRLLLGCFEGIYCLQRRRQPCVCILRQIRLEELEPTH